MEQTFIEIKKAIDGAGRILLVSHHEPDGDALGSMLALKLALEKTGKSADVFCFSDIPANLKVLPSVEKIVRVIESPYDLIIGMDYGDLGHLETMAVGLDKYLPDITFDHHPFVNQAGRLKIIDPNFSSTCEIIYKFLSVNRMAINREIAICLLTGIFGDTGGFRHSNTTAETLKITADLLSRGVSLTKIAQINAAPNNIANKTKIWSRALSKIIIDEELHFVICFLTHKDMSECGAGNDDLSGLASMLCMIPGARFSLVLREIEAGQIDGSFRAMPNTDVDVSLLARSFGGGGHKLSAGFKTQDNPEKIISRVKKLIRSKD